MLVEERDQIGRIVVFITIIEVECGKNGELPVDRRDVCRLREAAEG